MNPFMYLLLILADHVMPVVRALPRLIVLLVQREYHRHALMKRLEERQVLLDILLEMTSLEGEMKLLVHNMAVLQHSTADADRKEKMVLMQRAEYIKARIRALERRAHMVDPDVT